MKDEGSSQAEAAAGAEAPSDPREPDPRASDRDVSELAAGFSAILAELAHAPAADMGRLAPPPREGDTLGRFVLRRELGRGGMGVVWEADDPTLARRVALKLVRTGTRASARGDDWLQREAEAVARLGHPAIVTLHDFGTSEAGPYLVFERLHGRGLDRALLDGPLPYSAVLQLASSVAGALDHAHAAGVIHRDLKPGNVFLLDGGGVKVLDFGLAALLGQSGLGDAGTPAFMAPEQWQGQLGDARTDLFSLGVTLWNALTGALPYPVADGRSAAAGPGETPRLPREVAPASFRLLVERCLDRDPARRPASAREVLDALGRIQAAPARRARQRTTGALLLAAVAGFTVAGWLWWHDEPPPGDRLVAVVADPRNDSGLPALDDLARLLTTSLEQSRRLSLLSRPRLAALAREARLEQPDRLDAQRARDLARLAHARVLLLPEARRDGGRLRLQVKAVDPDDEHLLFERSALLDGPAEVPAAVDELAEGLRSKLRERRDDLVAGRIQLASAVSPNLDAARAYYQGIDCWMSPSDRQANPVLACPPHFRAALAADPAFALAHFWLARTLFVPGTPPEEVRPHVAAAMAAVGRLPAREALLVRSWAAHVEGRSAEAEALADEAVARFPDDLEALSQARALHQARGDLPGAIPYVERMAALEPEAGESQVSLVQLYRALDRREELSQLVRRLEQQPPTPAVDEALVNAYLGLGRGADAVGRAQVRYEQLGTASARSLLSTALGATGRFAEAEDLVLALARERPESQHVRLGVASNLASQGRLREALRAIEEAEIGARSIGAGATAYLRAVALSLGADDAAFRAAVASAVASDRESFAVLALPLALRGDLAHAEPIAAALPPGPVRTQYEALRGWRRGEAAEAIGALQRQLESGLEPPGGYHPAYLLAEVSLQAGDAAGALAAVDRYRRSRVQGYWGSVTLPRCGLLAARAHLALGHLDEARTEVDRLLAGLARADADLPLLREARALRAGLGR